MGNAFYTRDQFPKAIFGTRLDGSIIAVVFQINPILGFFAAALYVQWCWDGKLDVGFTSLGGWSIDSSDAAAVERIIRSGGHWDASWERLKNGDDYYNSPIDHQQYEGGPAVSRRLTDWLIGQNVHSDEEATDAQWMPAFMAEQQTELDTRLNAAVKPPVPPHADPAYLDWHPNMVGQISDGMTLELAQTTRMTLAPDTTGRMIFGKIPVPQ